ncbi:hypothetical protein RQP46_002095 [Phenoliferia psychrophenolica]
MSLQSGAAAAPQVLLQVSSRQVTASDGSSESADSSPPAPEPPTLLSLPPELLDLIFEELDIEPLRLLRCVCKSFDFMARRCGELDLVQKDEAWIDTLFKTDGINDVRKVLYSTPSFGQITFSRTLGLMSSLTELEIHPAQNANLEKLAVSKYISDALRCLPCLKKLNLHESESLEDESFFIADHLPSLRHLILDNRGYYREDGLASLFREPCSLKSLQITAINLSTIQPCLVYLQRLSVVDCCDFAEQSDGFLAFEQLAEAAALSDRVRKIFNCCEYGSLFGPELAQALAAVFKFARESKVCHLNITYLNPFFPTPLHVPDTLPPLSSVRTLILETSNHDVKNEAEAAAIFEALAKFLKLFPNLEQLTLRGWFGKGRSWHKMTPRSLTTLPYFDLFFESRYTDLLLAVIRAAPVHLFVARWINGSSVRFRRRPGTTEEFERERFSTKMTVHEQYEVAGTGV